MTPLQLLRLFTLLPFVLTGFSSRAAEAPPAGSVPSPSHPGQRFAGKRPQEPAKPYPYVEEEVWYENTKAMGARFAGTLTKPRKGAPFPVVLLITGSGAQNRDEELMGHKPFLVLADHLTRRGIAVMRVDDRGVGGSTGDMTRATTKDFVGDALAGVAYLRSRPDIDRRHIGLIGHSEGGLIAPAVAVSATDVAFIVLMAAPGVRGADILARQNELIGAGNGLPTLVAAFNREMVREINEVILDETKEHRLIERLEDLVESKSAEVAAMFTASPEEKELVTRTVKGTRAQIKGLASPWMRYFVAYDPAPVLKLVQCPVLAINGTLDMQVPADQNLPLIEAALKAGGNKDYTVIEMPRLNHVLQTASTGMPFEYGMIDETISPDALKLIGDWVIARAGIRAVNRQPELSRTRPHTAEDMATPL